MRFSLSLHSFLSYDKLKSKINVKQFLARERDVWGLTRVQSIFNSFSITEKVFFLVLVGIFMIAVLALVYRVNSHYMVEIPAHGGQLTEGIVGTPRFINPLLAISDADRDLTALVYSGLIKATPGGDFVPDLALRYSISADGLSYTFVIRPNAIFHDGKPVTSEDVIYTIGKAQDSALKSPRRVNWEGVSMEKVNDHEIVFKLKQPYAPFISFLSLGILPKHIWKNIEGDQFTFSLSNLNAIGSGPYKIESIDRDRDNIPNQFNLRANSDYVLGEPYIQKIFLKFYQNETSLVDALGRGAIESAGSLGPETIDGIADDRVLMRAPLTRVFGVFFNQNEKEILAHKEVRKALSLAIDKNDIILRVLHGYGTRAEGPLPPTSAGKYSSLSTTTGTTTVTSIDSANLLLQKAGWKKNPNTGIFELKRKNASSTLSFSLATANIPELVESAHIIEEAWKKLGASVLVRIFEPGDLNQSVIRPRKYDSLLFGIVTGRNPDLYPFWHSSQRNDPGLNIALYTNTKADKLLESMRSTSDSAKAKEALANFEKEIESDTPAIFIWSPDFIYVVPKKLSGASLGEITTPADRFLNIHNWYVKTDKVWRIFASDRDSIVKNNQD